MNTIKLYIKHIILKLPTWNFNLFDFKTQFVFLLDFRMKLFRLIPSYSVRLKDNTVRYIQTIHNYLKPKKTIFQKRKKNSCSYYHIFPDVNR